MTKITMDWKKEADTGRFVKYVVIYKDFEILLFGKLTSGWTLYINKKQATDKPETGLVTLYNNNVGTSRDIQRPPLGLAANMMYEWLCEQSKEYLEMANVVSVDLE